VRKQCVHDGLDLPWDLCSVRGRRRLLPLPGPPTCAPDSGLSCDPFYHQCMPPALEVLPMADAGDRCGLGVADCSAGSFCYAPVFPDNGVCTLLIEDGGGCDPTGLFGSCANGLVCVGYGTSLDAGICRPPWPAGGACVTRVEAKAAGSSRRSRRRPSRGKGSGVGVMTAISGRRLSGYASTGFFFST
jgi:hypothetical protein